MTHQGPEFSLLAALVVSHCEPFCFLKWLATGRVCHMAMEAWICASCR
jgi:hypothetical protein